MKFQKIANLIDVEINDESRGTYNASNQIKSNLKLQS